MAGLACSPSVLRESTFLVRCNVGELSHVRVQLRFQIVRIYIHVYIYVAVRQVICACSVVRNVGRVKCNHFHKHSNHVK